MNIRTPINNKNCFQCKAFSICGFGCAHNAKVYTKDFLNPDPINCLISKYYIDIFLKDLFDIVKKNINEMDYYLPSQKQRRLLYGNVIQSFSNLQYSIGHQTF